MGTDSCRQNFHLYFILWILITMVGSIIHSTTAIECIVCADISSIAESFAFEETSSNSTWPELELELPEASSAQDDDDEQVDESVYRLDGCAKLNPNYITYVQCSSEDDICIKTVVYGSGGQGRNLITRGCKSLSALQEQNGILNDTKDYHDGKCFSEDEIPSPSPPYLYLLCICQTDHCNMATMRNRVCGVGSTFRFMLSIILLLVS